ncbi:MAG: phosphotransferase [Nocardioidaceae bacterium]
MIDDVVAELGLWDGSPVTCDPLPTMASPSWWGADSDRYVVRGESPDPVMGPSVVVRVLTPRARRYVDVSASFAAARAAGEQGIGPKVHLERPDLGVLVMEDLSPVSRTASLRDLGDPDLLAAVVDARVRVHNLAGITRRASLFDDLRAVRALVAEDNQALPRDATWMLRVIDEVEALTAEDAPEDRPCHGDGNMSNVMIDGDGRVRLVDWDSAGLMDPMRDLGSLLLELSPRDTRARDVFTAYWGSWDEVLFGRARLYGAIEGVYRGWIGVYNDQEAPGTHEYSKFADWQFLRARSLIQELRFDERLHPNLGRAVR